MGFRRVLASLAAVVLVATGLSWTQNSAAAAAGDLAHGVVVVDSNRNNTIDATGVAGTADLPLAGVTVNLLDGADQVIASVVTGADGAWAFVETAIDGQTGPFAVQLDASTSNGGVYVVPTAASADNRFVRSGPPALGAAPLVDGAADVELNALVYPTWALDLAPSAGSDGLSVRTGRSPGTRMTPPTDGTRAPAMIVCARQTSSRSAGR